MTDLPNIIVSMCLVSYNFCMIPHVWALTFGLNLSGAWGDLHQASYPRSEHCQTRLTCLLPGQDRSGDDWGQHQRIQKWIDSGGRKLVHGWICLDCKKILVKYTWSKVLKETRTYQNLKRRLVFSLIQSVERIDNKSLSEPPRAQVGS